MNPAHLHLLVNHIGPIAAVLSIPVLFLAIVQPQTLRAGLLLLFIVGIGGLAADVTGDDAEDYVEGFPGTEHETIHDHKEQAEPAIALSVVTAVLAVGAAFLEKRTTRRRQLAALLLGLAALNAGLMARAAYSGGAIRHPEAKAGFDVKQLEPHADPETEAL